jgi:TonB family protein
MIKLALILVLMAAPAFAAETPAPEFRLAVVGELVVGPDGTVRDYSLEAGQAPLIENLIEKSVTAWKFEPVLMDGKPVVAKTRMSLSILASPAGDDYALRVDDVWFGDFKSTGKTIPPRYPKAALKEGVEARVLLTARVDASGKVVDVHPYQTSLSRKGHEARWRRLFEAASMEAARQWTYEPDQFDGRPQALTTVQIPLEFTLVQGSTKKEMAAHGRRWRTYLPGPVTPAPWVDADSVAALGDLDDGRAGVLDSRFKLRSDVLGKLL